MIVMIVHLIDDYFFWILYYIPYYHLLKFIFFLTLFHPKTLLAGTFYDAVIIYIYKYRYFINFI